MHDAAVALNAAFVDRRRRDRRQATARAVDKPIEIAHVTTGGSATAVRNRVEIGAGANVRVIETYRGRGGADYQVNADDRRSASARGATVAYARLQAEGDAATAPRLDDAAAGRRRDRSTT